MRQIYTIITILIIITEIFFGQTNDTIIRQCLVLKSENSMPFNVLTPDPVSSLLTLNKWEQPGENSELLVNGNTKGNWQKLNANENGWFEDDLLGNTYAYAQYNSDKERIALLEAMSHNMVYVNGTPRSGNPYQYKETFEAWEPKFNYSLIPIKLNKGINEFVFECRRGRLKVVIHPVEEGVIFNKADVTVPDLIRNENTEPLGSIVIINASKKSFKDLYIKSWSEGSYPVYHKVNYTNPLSVLKTPFNIRVTNYNNKENVILKLQIIERKASGESILDSTEITLNIKNNNELHKETFISNMDGSVQYYAVNPPQKLNVEKPALFLSLHGASVEAINQAGSYFRKNWGYIISPTNRRPYGYNWESWGRIDALEVLDIAKKKFNPDENRIYLTGHSMGGHGTWHLGVSYADQFAAIAPSAGWISFWSYRTKALQDSTSQLMKMLVRSTKQSDTYALTHNLSNNGIYILHGGADDVVSPEQAKSMVSRLSDHHKDFIYYEQPGAGHWWDSSDEDGSDCVDWLPIFDFFAHHSRPLKERIRKIEFSTANPAISSKHYWIEIQNQKRILEFSKINILFDPGKNRYKGNTENIERLVLDVTQLDKDKEITIELDSTVISKIKYPESGKLFLDNQENYWKVTEPISTDEKNPVRYGTIKEVFTNNMVFVYGTSGNDEENKWSYDKARYDAERFWYQGNGNVPLIPDNEFNIVDYKDRNIIIYGNSETNTAWEKLLKKSPVQVTGNKIVFGDTQIKGKDIACIMTYPIDGSSTASVGVISGTGLKGMKLTNTAPYFNPASNLPDLTIFDQGIIASDEDGVIVTGFFGNDWSLDKGEFIKKLNRN